MDKEYIVKTFEGIVKPNGDYIEVPTDNDFHESFSSLTQAIDATVKDIMRNFPTVGVTSREIRNELIKRHEFAFMEQSYVIVEKN